MSRTARRLRPRAADRSSKETSMTIRRMDNVSSIVGLAEEL
jgi:hypothetical protein